MKLFHPAFVKRAAAITAVCLATLGNHAVLAQDSAFLACARHTDRGQRIACLEDALAAAVAAQEAQRNRNAAPPPAPAPMPEVAEVPAVPAASPAPVAPAVITMERDERSSILERIRSFGRDEERQASISTDDSGKERLQDTIADLEKRNELWTVTLSSGQVWRQVYPRTLNLRVGDEISIYQEGIGDGYRLATPGLSGFIRVERTR